MSVIDISIIIIYAILMVIVGLYFAKRQTSSETYFVGSRSMGAGHLGFSIVATDVGGGFSIGLGGLGFSMGLAGSWLLFTGLLGAWFAAIFLLPQIKEIGDKEGWLSFPDFLAHRYDQRTKTLAALVSGIGYAGFVGAQILAGAKLASVAFNISQHTAIIIMAIIVVSYTSLGGLEAVVYTDSIQWAILLIGLAGFALPFGYHAAGGFSPIKAQLPAAHLSLTNIAPSTFFVWLSSIVPIWFVGNTLYQRIYAAKDLKQAKRAFYLAGFLEWPLMAFLGVTLGMFARILFPSVESELGLPLLIRDILPQGIVGIVLAAYFSAIMSTADSCLLAATGHFITDIYQHYFASSTDDKHILKRSRQASLFIGLFATLIASLLPKVLDGILLAYAFMVSGLFVPTISTLISKKVTAIAGFTSMLIGGSSALIVSILPKTIWPDHLQWLSEPTLIAIPTGIFVLITLQLLTTKKS